MALTINIPGKRSPPCHSRVSDSPEKDNSLPWSSGGGSPPPWLQFHLGISRWQLYDHQDPNMEALVQQLATHRIVSAGVQLDLYCVLLPCFSSGERQINAGFSLRLPWNESVKL